VSLSHITLLTIAAQLIAGLLNPGLLGLAIDLCVGGTRAVGFLRKPYAGKTVRERGDPLDASLFLNTLLDPCWVDTAGIPLVWTVALFGWSEGSAIVVFPMIISRSCRNMSP
jgi:hypothetical protein